ncbi:MAG: 50S ribosomal protein L25 [Candidatus Nanopelagicales bacterium]|nr:50S ribosomal protein L25 [Candidatus Nanopelagicales bacterium]
MSTIAISAQERSDFGKGAARRLRREGLVPAVIYGHGTELLHVSLPNHDLDLALRKSYIVLSVSLNGKTILAMPRDIQREPVKRYLEHVDLIVITPEEATARTAFGVKATADAAEALAANEAARAAEAPAAPAAEAEAQ